MAAENINAVDFMMQFTRTFLSWKNSIGMDCRLPRHFFANDFRIKDLPARLPRPLASATKKVDTSDPVNSIM
jgi:hypothetical protein